MNDIFYSRYGEEIEKTGKSMEKQLLEDIVPFWEKRAGDWENGDILTALTGPAANIVTKNRAGLWAGICILFQLCTERSAGTSDG